MNLYTFIETYANQLRLGTVIDVTKDTVYDNNDELVRTVSFTILNGGKEFVVLLTGNALDDLDIDVDETIVDTGFPTSGGFVNSSFTTKFPPDECPVCHSRVDVVDHGHGRFEATCCWCSRTVVRRQDGSWTMTKGRFD